MSTMSLWKTIYLLCVLCAVELIGSPTLTFTTLHSFDGTDGEAPNGPPVQGTDGNFYGTTNAGGANCSSNGGCGTVFKITPSGRLTTLHSFNGANGKNPIAGLVLGTNGEFYGTTGAGGAHTLGTVFKITPNGTLTTLHSFAGYPKEG